MKDLMLDIETLDTKSTAVITQIGACFFDRYTGEIGDKFIVNIDIDSCQNAGLTLNGDTIKWWFEQKERSWLYDTTYLMDALAKFYIFMDREKQLNGKLKGVWSHSTFDIPILMNAFRVCGIIPPFSYRTTRDIRTLVDLAKLPYNKPKDDKTHNALDDCIYQVKYCVECFNRLKGEQNEKSN